MPLAFLFYEHGFEPRWECEAEETRSVFQQSPQGARRPVEVHGRYPAGPAKDAVPQQKGASAATGLQVDEVFRTHIVIHQVGKFSTILRPVLLALPHTHLLGTTGF